MAPPAASSAQPTPRSRWLQHALALGLMATGAALRLPGLDALPSPAGDETNWLALATALARGEAQSLAADAAFVPPTFAHLLSWGVRALGPTFVAARTALAVAYLVGVAGVYALAWSIGLRRGAVALVALLCLHAWPLAWTRVAAVPYALGLLVAVAGPLAWQGALALQRPWLRTLGLVGAAQLLVLGLHFSPLGALPLVGCALALLVPGPHAALRTCGPWLALVAALAHALPLVAAALTVAGSTGGTAQDAPWQDLGTRTLHYLTLVPDGWSGVATVRHFAVGPCTPAGLYPWPWRVLWLAGLSGAIVVAGAGRARAGTLVLGAVALVGVPLLLAPIRTWWLPTIDAERYLYVLLAPAWLLLAQAADAHPRGAWLAAALVASAGVPTAVGVHAALGSAGPDCGLHVVDGGGGWRGFRAVRGADGRLHSQSAAVWQAAEAAADGAPYTLVAHDEFGQQALGWPPERAADERHPLAWVRGGSWPVLPRGRVVVVPLYAPGVFVPRFGPAEPLQAAAQVRAHVQQNLAGVRHAATLLDAGGVPLWQVWVGHAQ